MTGPAAPQLGLVLPPAVPPQFLRPAVEAAEQGGFGSIRVTDRTLSDVPWLETYTLLGALAGAQYLSGGRVVAGVGLGGLRPGEFELCGMETSQRAPVTDEYLPLLRRLWTERPSTTPGSTTAANDVQQRPLPEVPIPIWIWGCSPGAFARAGRFVDGWLSANAGPDGFWAGLSQVHDHAAAAGRDPASLAATADVFAAIGRHEGEAEAVLDPAVRGSATSSSS